MERRENDIPCFKKNPHHRAFKKVWSINMQKWTERGTNAVKKMGLMNPKNREEKNPK